MKKFKSPEVAKVFKGYPKQIRDRLMFLCELVFSTVSEIENVGQVEEALKWGEPSYLVKGGSTIRMDWIRSSPDNYAMYFHCRTKLVDTFKELYKEKFKFEGNRAIVFNKSDKLPVDEIKHCILLSLTYHGRKNLPLLGA